jgi:hypothetical protein
LSCRQFKRYWRWRKYPVGLGLKGEDIILGFDNGDARLLLEIDCAETPAGINAAPIKISTVRDNGRNTEIFFLFVDIELLLFSSPI